VVVRIQASAKGPLPKGIFSSRYKSKSQRRELCFIVPLSKTPQKCSAATNRMRPSSCNEAEKEVFDVLSSCCSVIVHTGSGIRPQTHRLGLTSMDGSIAVSEVAAGINVAGRFLLPLSLGIKGLLLQHACYYEVNKPMNMSMTERQTDIIT